MYPYSGFANPVSICLLDNVLLRGVVDIGSFMIPLSFSVRGIPAANANAAKENAANKKVAIVIVVAPCYGTQKQCLT